MSHVSITGANGSGTGPFTITVNGTNTSHNSTTIFLEGIDSDGFGVNGNQVGSGSPWSVQFTPVNAGVYTVRAKCNSDNDAAGPVPVTMP